MSEFFKKMISDHNYRFFVIKNEANRIYIFLFEVRKVFSLEHKPTPLPVLHEIVAFFEEVPAHLLGTIWRIRTGAGRSGSLPRTQLVRHGLYGLNP
jgi:hypothetical protein